jgi:L-iditol 2-dehydrogenase
MKAAFLVGPRKVDLREVPSHKVPADGVILRMMACGVCGSDLRRWTEGPPAGASHLVQGHELAGVVVESGPTSGSFRVGERLAVAPDIHCGTCWYCRRGLFNVCPNLKLLGITVGLEGGFAEFVVLPGELLRNGIVHRMPESLGFREGGFAETVSSVLAAHEKASTALGETVVVMGAGPIGCLHVVIARARGARTIVSEPNSLRRAGVAKFAPDCVIDPSAEDVVAVVKRETNDIGADVVICANPVGATQTQAVEVARRGGRIVLFGGLPKNHPVVGLNTNLIHYGEQMVIGAFSYHPRFHEQALETLERKVVRAEEFITHTRPLSRVSEAFEIAASGQALKVMIEPD